MLNPSDPVDTTNRIKVVGNIMPNQISSQTGQRYDIPQAPQAPANTKRPYSEALKYPSSVGGNSKLDQTSGRKGIPETILGKRQVKPLVDNRDQTNLSTNYAGVTASTADNSNTFSLNDTTSNNKELVVGKKSDCTSKPSYKKEGETSVRYSRMACNPASKPNTTVTSLSPVTNKKILENDFYQIIEAKKLPVLQKWKTPYQAYLHFLKNPGSFKSDDEVFFLQQVCYYIFRNKREWSFTGLEYMIRHYQQTNNPRIFEKLAGMFVTSLNHLNNEEFKKERNKAISEEFINILKLKTGNMLNVCLRENLELVIAPLTGVICFMSRAIDDYTPIKLLHDHKVIDELLHLIEKKSLIIRSEIDGKKRSKAEDGLQTALTSMFTLLHTYHFQEISGHECKKEIDFRGRKKKYTEKTLNLVEENIDYIKKTGNKVHLRIKAAWLVLNNYSKINEQISMQNLVQVYEKKITELKKIDSEYNKLKNPILAKLYIAVAECYSIQLHKESRKKNSIRVSELLEKLTESVSELANYEQYIKSKSELQNFQVDKWYFSSMVERQITSQSVSGEERNKIARDFVKDLELSIERVDSFIPNGPEMKKQKEGSIYNKERLIIEKIAWLLLSTSSEERSRAENVLRSTDFNYSMGKHYKAITLFEVFDDHKGAIELLERKLKEHYNPETVYRTFRSLSHCYFDMCRKDQYNADNWAVNALHYAHQTYLSCHDKSMCWEVYIRACEAMNTANLDINKFLKYLPKELEKQSSSWMVAIDTMEKIYKANKLDCDNP